MTYPWLSIAPPKPRLKSPLLCAFLNETSSKIPFPPLFSTWQLKPSMINLVALKKSFSSIETQIFFLDPLEREIFEFWPFTWITLYPLLWTFHVSPVTMDNLSANVTFKEISAPAISIFLPDKYLTASDFFKWIILS